MNSGRNVAACVLFAVLFGSVHPVSANTPEDIQGAGARNNAMGGAATASVNDFTATYYNPAALSRCTDDHIGVDIRHTAYALHVRRTGADAPPSSTEPTRDQTRISTGFCLHLPYNITFGLMFGIGVQNQMTIDVAAPNSRPQWIMYGDSLEQLTINVGFAYKPIEQLSLGFGGSILVNFDLGFRANVPVAVDNDNDGYTDPIEVNLSTNFVPSGAPYLGIHAQPIPQIKLGLTYRGPMYLNLDVPATIRAEAIGGIEIPIPIAVNGLAMYSPRQLAFGAAVDPLDNLTLTADVTFYNWGALSESYYPYLAVAPQPGYEDGIVGQIGYPRMGRSGWTNVIQPRVGGELRLLDSRFAIRGGYSYRKSALPLPGSRTMLSNDGVSQIPNITTLLDGSFHQLSFGGGYTFGSRADERAAEAEAEETAAPATARLRRDIQVLPYDTDGFELEPIDERSAQRAPRTTTTSTDTSTTIETVEPMQPASAAATPSASPTAASPATVAEAGTTAVEDEEEESELPGLVGTIDVFLRANFMQNRVDTNKDISYGGSIYDAGIQLTLGWY